MEQVKKKKKKKWPWVLLGVGVVIVLLVMLVGRAISKAASALSYTTYTVGYGDIEETVTGSGTLDAAKTVDVPALAGVKVDKVLVDPGDEVKTGDRLASVDTKKLDELYDSLASQISSLDQELARMSRSKTQEYVYSPAKGRVKRIICKKGDDVSEAMLSDGALIVLSTDEKMQVSFTASADVPVKSSVKVKLASGKTKEGLVESAVGRDLIVTLTDDGPKYGDSVEVYWNDALVGSGTLTIHAPVTVVAPGGTVDKIHVEENDNVSMGTKLLTLTDEAFTSSYQAKYQERVDAADQFALVVQARKNPYIVATADGIVREINITDNTIIQSPDGDDEVVAFTLNAGSATELTVDIDELDIASIALGQSATVTVDALGDEKLDATVTGISRAGDAAKGVTTYQVKLALSDDSRLYAGMNATATVVTNQKSHVLVIPMELIKEDEQGEYTYLGKDARGTDQQRVSIVTGASDGINAEVVSGLKEGDVLSYLDDSAQNAMLKLMQNGPYARLYKNQQTQTQSQTQTNDQVKE